MGELVPYQQIEVVFNHECRTCVDGEVHVGHGADKFVAVLGPKREAAHDVVVERPVFALVEMPIDETAQRIAVAEGTPCLFLIAVFVAEFILDAVDVVVLVAQESTVGEVVEVAFPCVATVGLATHAEVEAVLRQHLHVGVTSLEGEIVAIAEVGLIKSSAVLEDGLRLC